ncbi:4727_t:CDS:2 [Paraglomus brasilianum]|uniref:4727_t:CDS:1 n=1 Tax=Paraglomus brasilianum TaxID=144538 RepID=A0A9N8WAM1_9GLOM|nr:4727_t:CDS:2 [Paraglomus brasilianum]
MLERFYNLIRNIEEEEGDDESSSKSLSNIFTKDAEVALETAFNFLQLGDMEINYDEFKAFRERWNCIVLQSKNKLE